MAKQTIEVLIEGGKATAAPPIGSSLGPTGVNIGQVVADINKRTNDFKGMKVPVKIIVDTDSKTYEIEIGTPPASQLIKTEAGVKSGAANPLTEKVADLLIEQVIKIAQMKKDSLLGNSTKTRCKEIMGTCQSMGIMVEGMPASEALKAVDEGRFDAKIESGKTELSDEEKAHLAEEKKRLAEELKVKKAEFTAQAKLLFKEVKEDARKARKRMIEAGIPMVVINEIAPAETK